MKKKAISVILAGAMALTLGACGSSSSTSSSSSSDVVTTGATSTATTSGSSANGDVEELSLWHYFDAADGPMIDQLVNEFNKENPDIHVTATFVSREELMNQYTVGAVSGELPDIGMVDSPDMASYIKLGVFEDITDELNDWGQLDKFYAGPLESCKDSDGKVYGLPQNSNCLALAVNMDLLKKAGYDHTPTSAKEFAEMVAATTDASTSTYGFAMSAVSNEEGTFQLLPWLCATRDGKKGSVSDIDSATCSEGLQMLGDFVKNGYMSKEVVNWSQSDAYNQFTSGKAAFEELGTWQLPTIADDVNGAFNYQVVLLPTGDEGTTSSVIGGENFGVCAGSKHKEAAVKFLEYFCSKEEEKSWSEGAGKLPTRSDVTPNYSYEQDAFKVFQEEMNSAMARGPHAEWPTISEAIYTAAQSVMVNGNTAKDALKTAAGTIDPILKENPLPAESSTSSTES